MHMKRTGKSITTVALLSLVGMSAQQAQAATIIELSDGITTVSVTDGGIGDLSATPGVVVFSGAVGVFDVNVTTGLSYPLLGSLTAPKLDLNSVNVSSGGTGILTVKLTTTDYVGPVGSGAATLDAGGTTNGSIGIDSYVGLSNSPFETSVATGSLGVFSSGPFSGTDGSVTPLLAPYSATIIATIVHDDAADVTSFDAEYNIVPEPASAALLGMGVLALARRRRG